MEKGIQTATSGDVDEGGSVPTIDLNVTTISASKTGKDPTVNKPLDFKVDARLEEVNRSPRGVTIEFNLKIATESSVVKFEVGGSVTVEGEIKDIERMMTPDSSTHVPALVSEIYRRIYSLMFLLASGLQVSYPAAGLLHPDHTQPARVDSLEDEPVADTGKNAKDTPQIVSFGANR